MGRNVDIVKGMYESFGKGDVPAVLERFHPEIQWNEAEGFLYDDGNPYVGPQAVAEKIFQHILGDVQDFAVIPATFIDGGDTVVVEGRYKGRMKATGTPIDAQVAHVWHLKDGKVVRFQQYTDTRQWARAAGTA